MNRYIYLHGFASGPDSGKARFFAAQLAARHLALEVPDLAAGDFEHLTITSQLDIVHHTIVDSPRAGEPVILLGSSMGGYLAALYAARHAEIQRLVLLAPAFGFARRWPETLRTHPDGDKLAEWQRSGTMEVFHYAEGQSRRIGYGLIEDGQRYEDYPAVTQPTLIFHGEADTVVPSAFSIEFARLNSHVELHLLPSDHQLLDVTTYFWDAIRAAIPELA